MRIVAALATVGSVGLMLLAIRSASKPQRVRVWRDALRAAVGIGGAVLIGVVTTTGTAPAILVLVGGVGILVGWFRGGATEVFAAEGRIMARSTPLALALFAVGLTTMQLASLANRAGVVRLGQAGSVFAACIGLGLISGRGPAVRHVATQKAMAGAAAVVVLGLLILPTLGSTREANASSAPVPRAELCELLGGGESIDAGSEWYTCFDQSTGDVLIDYVSPDEAENYSLSLANANRGVGCASENSLSDSCWEGEDLSPVSIGDEGLLTRWVPTTDRSDGYAIRFRRGRFVATIGELGRPTVEQAARVTPRTESSVTTAAQLLDARLVAWLENDGAATGDQSVGDSPDADESGGAEGPAEDGRAADEGSAADGQNSSATEGVPEGAATDEDITDEEALQATMAALATAAALGLLSLADAAAGIDVLRQHSKAGDKTPDVEYHDVGGFAGWTVDLDGDGLADVLVRDADRDGFEDTSGTIERERVPEPANGDGSFDAFGDGDFDRRAGPVPSTGKFEPLLTEPAVPTPESAVETGARLAQQAQDRLADVGTTLIDGVRPVVDAASKLSDRVNAARQEFSETGLPRLRDAAEAAMQLSADVSDRLEALGIDPADLPAHALDALQRFGATSLEKGGAVYDASIELSRSLSRGKQQFERAALDAMVAGGTMLVDHIAQSGVDFASRRAESFERAVSTTAELGVDTVNAVYGAARSLDAAFKEAADSFSNAARESIRSSAESGAPFARAAQSVLDFDDGMDATFDAGLTRMTDGLRGAAAAASDLDATMRQAEADFMDSVDPQLTQTAEQINEMADGVGAQPSGPYAGLDPYSPEYDAAMRAEFDAFDADVDTGAGPNVAANRAEPAAFDSEASARVRAEFDAFEAEFGSTAADPATSPDMFAPEPDPFAGLQPGTPKFQAAIDQQIAETSGEFDAFDAEFEAEPATTAAPAPDPFAGLQPSTPEFQAAIDQQIAETSGEFDAFDSEPGGEVTDWSAEANERMQAMYDEFDAWWNPEPERPRPNPDWRGFRVTTSSALA